MRHGAASASLQREWRVDPPKKRFFVKFLRSKRLSRAWKEKIWAEGVCSCPETNQARYCVTRNQLPQNPLGEETSAHQGYESRTANVPRSGFPSSWLDGSGTIHLERHEITGRSRAHLCRRWENASAECGLASDQVRSRRLIEHLRQRVGESRPGRIRAIGSCADGGVLIAIIHRRVVDEVRLDSDIDVFGKFEDV